MPSTGIQAFRMKPTWIERYVRDQSPEIHKRYQTTAAYLDVHSVGLPFHLDFDAKCAGAASLRHSWDTITWLFTYMRQAHEGPLFGEGNYHAVWAGRIDGCEAQIGGRGGEAKPVLVDFDLLKVHPLTVNHGMGYYSRWHRTRKGRMSDEDMTKYRAQELAYGHASFINTGMMRNLTQTLRECFLVQPVQAAYALAKPAEVRYLFDPRPDGSGQWVSARVACRTTAPRKVHVKYDNGLELWINDRRPGWRVAGRVLPAHGFVAKRAGVAASTTLRNDGLVGDYAETSRRIFADPRTYEAMHVDTISIVDVTPLNPVVQPLGDRKFRITYRWDVREALPKDYIIFVHFVDPEGRILWQNDHRPKTPTSQWQVGARYVDGPFDLEVPARIGQGAYGIRVGMFIPKQGRVSLSGDDAGGGNYRAGELVVKAGDAGATAVAFVPTKRNMSGHMPGRNPAGAMVDFGKLRTNIAIVVEKQRNGLAVMPIPHGVRGGVELRIGKLLPSAAGAKLHVTALGADRKPLAEIPSQAKDDTLSFETSHPKAWFYAVAPR